MSHSGDVETASQRVDDRPNIGNRISPFYFQRNTLKIYLSFINNKVLCMVLLLVDSSSSEEEKKLLLAQSAQRRKTQSQSCWKLKSPKIIENKSQGK